MINYSQATRGYAVNSSYNFTAVRNCVIFQGNSTPENSHGIYFFRADNGTIQNNSIRTFGAYGYGIFLSVSPRSNLTLNNITTSGSNYGYGIVADESHNSIISQNIINTTGATGYGIWLSATNSTIISSNIITTSGSSGSGIYLEPDSNLNLIVSNSITTFGSNGHGVHIYSSSNFNVINSTNISTIGGGKGIFISTSSYNNLNFNIIATTASSSNGIEFQGSSNNNINFNYITTSGEYGYGVYFELDSVNNSFSSLNVNTNNTGYAFYIYNDNNNFSLRDSKLNSSLAPEFYINTAVKTGTWNLTNVTRSDGSNINITWMEGANGTLNMHWYLDANVTSSGTAVESANVTAANRNSIVQFSELTASSGMTARKTLQEYTRNEIGTTFFTPYTITATKSGYNSYSNSTLNMTTNILLNIAMTSSSGGVTPSSGGGGGGGGGSSAKTYSIGNLTKEYAQDLAVNDKIVFNLLEQHSLKLTQLSASQATFVLNSSPITFSLNAGEKEKIDFNSDNIKDLSIGLVNISNSKARVSIQPIEEVVKTEQNQTQGSEQLTPAPLTGEGKKKFNYLILVIIIAIILAILAFILFKVYKKNQF